jgi:hypothetical protein
VRPETLDASQYELVNLTNQLSSKLGHGSTQRSDYMQKLTAAWRNHPLSGGTALAGVASGMTINSGRLRHPGLLQPLEEFFQGILKRWILVWNFQIIDVLYTPPSVAWQCVVKIIQGGDRFIMLSGKLKCAHQMRSVEPSRRSFSRRISRSFAPLPGLIHKLRTSTPCPPRCTAR